MSSADMNHPSNSGVWPEDPYGDMTPILEASVEAARERHPSGKDVGTTAHEAIEGAIKADGEALPDALTAADRCDAGCGAGALYRVEKEFVIQPEGYAQPFINVSAFEFCHHHHNRYFPKLEELGYRLVGQNATLKAELYR